MPILYYYLPKDKVDSIKDGIIISQYEKRTYLSDIGKDCLLALLSPKDDILKYQDDQYVCFEIETELESCYVLNGDLAEIQDQENYLKSRTPLSKYTFGTYRNPQIAICSDIQSSKINIANMYIGSPILFETSDKLYKSNLFEEFKLRFNDFDETMLGIFLMLMAHKGRFQLLGKKVVNKKTIYVYQENTSKKIYTIDVCEGLYNG